MYQAKSRLTLSIISFVSLLTLFCGDPVPVKEMGQAKTSIAKAEFAKADKYAPEKYTQARDTLLASHDLISKGDYKDAKEKAKEAEVLARKAFEDAAPKFAEETKAEAKMALGKAEERYAEQFAQAEYKNAQDLMASGDKKFNEGKTMDAYADYEKARSEAEKARNIAESQAEIMKRDISEIEDTLQEAEKYGAKNSAPTAFAAAEKHTKVAKKKVDEFKLREAFTEIEEAKKNAQQALQISQVDWAKKKNTEAQGKVADAASRFSKLKKQLGNAENKAIFDKSVEAQDAFKATEDSLNASQESLDASNKALKNQSYQDSYNQSEEAIRLSKIVEEQIPQVAVLVTEANKRADNNTTTTTGVSAKGWKKYKVRLNPKNRDCLWKIAGYKRHYKNARLWPRIYRANKSQIKNPDLIYPGQVFDIPPKQGSMQKPKATETTTENVEKNTDKKDSSTGSEASDGSKNAN